MKKSVFLIFSSFFGPKKTQGATFRSSSGSEILEMFKSFDKNNLSQRSGGVGSSSWAWFCIIRVLQVDWSAPQRDWKPLDRGFGFCVFYFPKMKRNHRYRRWPIEILCTISVLLTSILVHFTPKLSCRSGELSGMIRIILNSIKRRPTMLRRGPGGQDKSRIMVVSAG